MNTSPVISVCMIVKNEESVLGRCLKSLRGFWDELIVVDTGSSDATKDIAASFGAALYDLEWTDDFAAARNFAFSKASGAYIYSADADEELDSENLKKLLSLKAALTSGETDADIIQMYYKGQLTQDSVYNYDRELRPKLFKRLRPFVWEGAVHEQVRLEPAVLDSDIEITHKPHGQHAARDLSIFSSLVKKGRELPPRLLRLYARELFMAGGPADLAEAVPCFESAADSSDDADVVESACLVLLRAARIKGDDTAFLKYALRLMDGAKTSELCCELGEFYLTRDDPSEALIWFMQAGQTAEPVIDIRCGGVYAEDGQKRCEALLGIELG